MTIVGLILLGLLGLAIGTAFTVFVWPMITGSLRAPPAAARKPPVPARGQPQARAAGGVPGVVARPRAVPAVASRTAPLPSPPAAPAPVNGARPAPAAAPRAAAAGRATPAPAVAPRAVAANGVTPVPALVPRAAAANGVTTVPGLAPRAATANGTAPAPAPRPTTAPAGRPAAAALPNAMALLGHAMTWAPPGAAGSDRPAAPGAATRPAGAAAASTPGAAPAPQARQPFTRAPAAPQTTFVWRKPPEGGEGVLLVEDDDGVAAVYRVVLEKGGHRVRREADMVQAMVAVRQHLPAVVLLDMTRIGVEGLGFLEAIRAWPPSENTPVVPLSSNVPDPTLIARAMRLGALEYVVKANVRPHLLAQAIPYWSRGTRALTP